MSDSGAAPLHTIDLIRDKRGWGNLMNGRLGFLREGLPPYYRWRLT
jgi:hypothetical protein